MMDETSGSDSKLEGYDLEHLQHEYDVVTSAIDIGGGVRVLVSPPVEGLNGLLITENGAYYIRSQSGATAEFNTLVSNGGFAHGSEQLWNYVVTQIKYCREQGSGWDNFVLKHKLGSGREFTAGAEVIPVTDSEQLIADLRNRLKNSEARLKQSSSIFKTS